MERLLNSTRFAKEYNETLVDEFFVNLDESISEVESSFHGVVYVRKEIAYFNMEELYAFLGVPIYYEIKGSSLKEEIDLDMITNELTGGYKTT
ncbi:hypothetical protein M9H77_28284 [Catharanthus roseus]|uniref:Uncharacterized protein n=1 Tax=Catharanthus roseus TaxID=4058 RepID=A0ACC0AJ13_CATRO|nr:hypothetical protein M9H77_28284 [Catharanthus roseus]